MFRFLDSIGATANDRAPLGVLRAEDVKVFNRRLYFRIGNTGVAEFDPDAFLARADRSEALGFVSSPDHGRILQPSNWWNVYSMKSPGNADALGAEILKDFDVAADGTLCIAAAYGWCLVVNGKIEFQDNSAMVNHVIALQGALLLQSGGRSASIFNIANKAAPVLLPVRVPKIQAFAKSADSARVAIIDFDTRLLSVYTADGLATGALPIYRGSAATWVASDGTNFYVLAGTEVSILTPSGNTYKSTPAGSAEMSQPIHIDYGDGRVIVSGGTEWTIFTVAGTKLVRVPFGAPEATTIPQVNALAGTVFNGRPILCGKSVGFVYPKLEGAAQPEPKPEPPPAPRRFLSVSALGPNQGLMHGAEGAYVSTAVGFVRVRIVKELPPPPTGKAWLGEEFTSAAAAVVKYEAMKTATARGMVSTPEGTIVVVWIE